MFDFLKKSKNQSVPHNEKFSTHATYITTSEFAKICNVTRFTIRNWVKKKKIHSVETPGGHQRIPLAELLSFLESLSIFADHPAAKKNASGRYDYCWEHSLNKRKGGKCDSCIMYGSPVHHCALIAAHLGKERIQCEGNCQSCDYWRGLFPRLGGVDGLFRESTKSAPIPKDDKVDIREKDEQGFANAVSFHVGHGLHDLWNVLSPNKVTRVKNTIEKNSKDNSDFMEKNVRQREPILLNAKKQDGF